MKETLPDQQSIDALEKTLDLIAQEQETGKPNTEQQIYSKVFSTELDRQRQELEDVYNLPISSDKLKITKDILDNYADGGSFTQEEGLLLDSVRETPEYQLASEQRYRQARQNPSNLFQDGTTGRNSWEAPVNSNEGIKLEMFWESQGKEETVHDEGSLGEFWQREDEVLKNKNLESSISGDGLEEAMAEYPSETAQHEGKKQEIVQLLTPLKPPVRFRDKLSQLFKGN